MRLGAGLGRIHPYLPPLGEKLLAVDGGWGRGRRVTFLWDHGHWEGYPCFIGWPYSYAHTSSSNWMQRAIEKNKEAKIVLYFKVIQRVCLPCPERHNAMEERMMRLASVHNAHKRPRRLGFASYQRVPESGTQDYCTRLHHEHLNCLLLFFEISIHT